MKAMKIKMRYKKVRSDVCDAKLVKQVDPFATCEKIMSGIRKNPDKQQQFKKGLGLANSSKIYTKLSANIEILT